MSENRYNTTGWDKEQVRRETQSRSAASQRSAQEQAKKRTTKRRKKRKKHPILNTILYLVFVFLVSAVLAGVGWLLANDLCALNKEYKEVTLEVTKEDDVSSVTDKLEEAGLIEYKWFFRLFAIVSKADEKIGEGSHELNTDMDYRALIVGMKSKTGQSLTAETVRVTIPEGYTVAQTIALLAEKGVNTEEKLLEAAANHKFTDYPFIDNENLGDITRLEGYLFPDTYDFYVGEKPASVLDRFLSNFNRHITGEMLAEIEESGKTLREIVVVASLIEKETDGSDRKSIGSVIYNRINNPGFETGGLLQIDAALVYATGKAELTEDDKLSDSPYNLYKYKGLPPTAIANPGIASIQAAISPAHTDYYYYVLGNEGKHIYSTNYNDHLNVIAGLG